LEKKLNTVSEIYYLIENSVLSRTLQYKTLCWSNYSN